MRCRLVVLAAFFLMTTSLPSYARCDPDQKCSSVKVTMGSCYDTLLKCKRCVAVGQTVGQVTYQCAQCVSQHGDGNACDPWCGGHRKVLIVWNVMGAPCNP